MAAGSGRASGPATAAHGKGAGNPLCNCTEPSCTHSRSDNAGHTQDKSLPTTGEEKKKEVFG
jgi:hypothetical protein